MKRKGGIIRSQHSGDQLSASSSDRYEIQGDELGDKDEIQTETCLEGMKCQLECASRTEVNRDGTNRLNFFWMENVQVYTGGSFTQDSDNGRVKGAEPKEKKEETLSGVVSLAEKG